MARRTHNVGKQKTSEQACYAWKLETGRGQNANSKLRVKKQETGDVQYRALYRKHQPNERNSQQEKAKAYCK
jgi:hypothetical protein